MNPSPAAPRSAAEVQARYAELRALHQHTHNVLALRRRRALQGAAAIGVILLIHLFHFANPFAVAWLLYAETFAIVALVVYSMRQQAEIDRAQRLLSFHDRSLRRADATEPQSGRTGLEPGQELRTPGHIYEQCLDLLGPNSLFGQLATTRTGLGERGLVRYLLQPVPHEETLLRQQAVKELLPQSALRERIALLGTSSFQQIAASFFDTWLADASPIVHPAVRPILALTAILNVTLLLAGLTHLLAWSTIFPNLALTLCVQAAIALYLRPRLLSLLNTSARLRPNVHLIADGLALLQSTVFDSPKLKGLQCATLQPTGAVKQLKQLETPLTVIEQRSKEWYFAVSLLLAGGTQAAISIALWKRRHAGAMRVWLDAWSEFEALNALAAYAFEHPVEEGCDAWPELLPATHPPLYEARALGHPLLPNAVTNDIALGPDCRFYLISGSNMAGKSTLLRSVGINAVLAYAGAPVRAGSLRLTPLALGTSLALTDSLAEGRSKFLAEVERLAAILSSSASSPLLFLVDEIFSGTNSEDRRAAARAVLEGLLANQAIGALSTHDLALADLATPANTGRNVHMASPNPEDPLAFDYKLKPGVNTASSARAILRLIGIDT